MSVVLVRELNVCIHLFRERYTLNFAQPNEASRADIKEFINRPPFINNVLPLTVAQGPI